jgi:SprT-like family
MSTPTLFKFLIIAFTAICLVVGTVVLIWQYVLPASETARVEVVANTVVNQVSANKPAPIRNDEVEKDARLQTQADSLLNLFDNMPQVPVFLKDVPILKTGSEVERGLAYAICENKKPTIFIKKVFYQKNNQKQIVNILKHELTHAWFCRQDIKAEHDARFRKKFESVGGFGN